MTPIAASSPVSTGEMDPEGSAEMIEMDQITATERFHSLSSTASSSSGMTGAVTVDSFGTMCVFFVLL